MNDRALLLARPPAETGVRAALERALAAGPSAVLLTGAGLAWAAEADLAAAARTGRAEVALCTVSARALGWTPQTAPDWIAWSSVATWLTRHHDPGDRVLALYAADEVAAAGTEFLRVLVGYAAAGVALRLAALGAGRAALAADDLPDDAEAYLAALASAGVAPEPLDDVALIEALRAADVVTCHGASDRPRTPALLVLDAAALESDAPLLRAQLQAAGFVVRA